MQPISTSAPISTPVRKRAALATLGLAGLLAVLLSGCSSSPATSASAALSTGTPASYTAVAGNWRFTTASPRLSTFAGSLSTNGSAVTGTLHPVDGTCLGALGSGSAAFPVAGAVSSTGTLTLSSSTFSGGAVSIRGTLAPDQHSLVDPVITVAGGACATPSALPSTTLPSTGARDNSPSPAPTAQQYQSLTGTYTGTLTSNSGGSLALSATLSQGASPDANGNFHLTGSATFSDTSCIGAPVITDSIVSGNQISATYTDPSTGNSVTGSGTFSTDAQTLTISSWTLSGSCGNDTGSGLLSRSSH